MNIAIGSDHRGVEAKARLAQHIQSLGHQVVDLGTHSTASVDYPAIAAQVGREVAGGRVDRGILLCSTGVGMSIAANKIAGVRAAAVSDEKSAEMSRRHNDLNVLCLPADLLSNDRIDRLVDVWLSTSFEGGRHARRVDQIAELERGEEIDGQN